MAVRKSLNNAMRPAWMVWFLLWGCLLPVGCDQVESQFTYSQQTSELLPEAQQALKATLQETYGTPAEPRIPAYFPVNRGGFLLDIEEIAEEGREAIHFDSQEFFKQEGLTLSDLLKGKPRVEFLFDPEALFDARMEAIEEGESDPYAALQNLRLETLELEPARLILNQPLPDWELLDEAEQLVVNPNAKLRRGSKLYAQHCLHCHGVTGDGKGPTAPFMQPPPRDYRLGIFKFTSTGPQQKISTADLKHVLVEGIPGTYMPSFNMLPDADLDMLVEYVKFLAMRGETEKNLYIEMAIDFSQKVLDDELADAADEEERAEIREDFAKELEKFLKQDYPEIELGVLLDLAEAWERADAEETVLWPSVARPDPRSPSLANPELTSAENGRLLYLGKDAQCASCHGETGRGNGYQTFQFQKKRDGSLFEVVGLHDDWGNPLAPRDLTAGIYRGGRRPIDLFRRIYAGIKGTPMPVFGGKGLTDAQIWDIVNYLYVLEGLGARG